MGAPLILLMMVRGKKSPKSIAGALAITVMSLCVIYMASQEAAPEDVKYMPSVSDIVPGFNLDDSSDGDSSDDDDSSSSASKSSGDDADDFMSGLLGDSSSDDSSSSSSASDDEDDSSDSSLSEGDSVNVQYKLRLPNGKEVYRQWGDGDGGTFTFKLGGGGVIPGFDSAVSDMSVGETKRVTIDSDDAYGSKGFSAMGIPPDTDLHYTLKVVGKN